jgi:hypothetical protein
MDLEADEGIQQMIESVRELAKDFPDFIAWTLASLLDHLAQVSDIIPTSKHSDAHDKDREEISASPCYSPSSLSSRCFP